MTSLLKSNRTKTTTTVFSTKSKMSTAQKLTTPLMSSKIWKKNWKIMTQSKNLTSWLRILPETTLNSKKAHLEVWVHLVWAVLPSSRIVNSFRSSCKRRILYRSSNNLVQQKVRTSLLKCNPFPQLRKAILIAVYNLQYLQKNNQLTKKRHL